MKKPSYLSPSSLNDWETRPNTFYLTRMYEPVLPREPQGIPAAMGSAFDVFIKLMLCGQKGELDVLFNRLLKDTYNEADKEKYRAMGLMEAFYQMSVEEQNRSVVKNPGILLAKKYFNSKLCKSTEWVDFERHENFVLLGTDFNVPLYMKQDAYIKLNGVDTPHDWKVKGFNLDGKGVSPPPGYYCIEDEAGNVLPAHEKYRPDMPLEEIDKSWAAQLTTYGWGMGKPIGVPFKAAVDVCVYRPTGWRFARYKGWCTTAFQLELKSRYQYCWEQIVSGAFEQSIVGDISLVEIMASGEKWYGK